MKKSAKKFLSCFLAVLMLVCAVPMTGVELTASAAEATSGQCGDNVYWTLDENGTLTISGEGEMWNYQDYYMEDMDKGHEYPTYSENKTVEYEDFCADYCDTKVKKAIIENGVTSIGAYAFAAFFELRVVKIPDSVETIEGSAFEYCFNLIDVSIGNGVDCIQQYSFAQCRNLKEILIPDNVTNIYDDAFSCCYNLENVAIGKGTEYIGRNAFSSCNIKRLTIDSRNSNYCSQNNIIFNKDRTELIECYNSEISNYVIPDTVVTIDGYAFNDCDHLTDVTIPDSVTEIEYGAFDGCYNLKNVNIGNEVKSIGNGAFLSCESLTNIVIPSKVTLIEAYTFCGCENLMSITIPNTVNQIGETAFDGCDNLKDIYYWGTEKKWNKINIGDYNDSLINATIHYCNHNNITEYDLQPSTCEENGHTEGIYCNDCKTWLSGKSILSFGHGDNDSNNICDTCGINLKIIKRGYTGNVNWILYEDGTLKLYGGGWTEDYDLHCSDFYYLSDYITNIIIDDGVEYLGYGVFLGCNKVECVIIPSSIDLIGEAAFDGCSNLKYVYYNGTQKQWNNINIQEHNYNLTDATIHFMDEELPQKSGQCGDSVYWTFDENGTLTISGEGDMWNYESVDDYEAYLPSYMSYVNEIRNVVIENGVTSIGNYALQNCINLEKIEISNSVVKIGNYSFVNCSSLNNIIIPDSVIDIGNATFYGCSSLTSITIPDSVTLTGGYLFSYCDNLTSVTFGNGITEIWEYTFIGCDNLTSVTIGKNVKTVVWGAFNCCDKLKNVYYLGSEEQWNGIEIQGDNESLTNAKIHFAIEKPTSTTVTDPTTGVELTYDSDVLDKNVSLVVAPLADSTGNAIFKKDYASVMSYDISLEKDGEKVQPNGKVTVKIPLPQGYNADTTAVYYVSKDGKAEKLESTYDNGYVVFETDHFSEYVLVDESSAVPADPCTHLCHKGGFVGFIYKIIRVFWKLFKINKTCACGVNHY